MTGPTARPRSTTSWGTGGRRRDVVAAVAVAVVVGASALLGSGVVAGATPLATTTTTTIAPTTPAPTTAAPTTAAPTTAPRAPVTSAPPLQERVTESEAATTRLNRVVIALVSLALLIALATVVFWRLTRPDRGDRSSAAAAPEVGPATVPADGPAADGPAPAATPPAGPPPAGPAPLPSPAGLTSAASGAPDATSDDAVVRVVRRRRAGSGPGGPGGGR